MDGGGLFDNIEGQARRDAPGTSQQAAREITGSTGAKRRRILEYLNGRGALGATDQEIAASTGIPGDTVRPRRGELATQAAICKTGGKRPTAANRGADIWAITAKGRDALAATLADDIEAETGGADVTIADPLSETIVAMGGHHAL